MKALSKPQSLRQMMLFDEKRQLFEWHDLTETTKGDVISLAGSGEATPDGSGGRR
jgi:hypothetical protein